MSLMVSAACISHPGHIRLGNEDNFSFNGQCLAPNENETDGVLTCERDTADGLFFAVFDGMGGENYGELASFIAAREALAWPGTSHEPLRALERLALYLNDVVVNKAESMLTHHMGTTMAALYFLGNRVFLCNVGDSRIYRLRGGDILQISVDHLEDPSSFGVKLQRKLSLSQFLGIDPEEFQIEPYLWQDVIFPGDRYILCSDGLTDMVSPERMKEILKISSVPEAEVQIFLQAALSDGGKDNITIIECSIK